MQKIVPHLWYDTQAKEAALFYASVFPNSKVTRVTKLHDTPSGTAHLVSARLWGQEFMLISAGPYFRFTPAVSFMVSCTTKAQANAVWRKLSKGGHVLMPLGEYPFSPWFGWVADKYGLTWQIMLAGTVPSKQRITPAFMFVGKNYGMAEAAIRYYAALFKASNVGTITHYPKNDPMGKPGTVKFASFRLEGNHFAAMDSPGNHPFTFNEAVSFIIRCKTQSEIDYYWKKLSAVPAAEQCGWLKDKYGVSWQVVPALMDELLQSKDAAQVARVTQAFLKMKKFDVAALKKAAKG